MKKILFGFIATVFIATYANARILDNPIIEKFVKSKEFAKNKDIFNEYGQIDFDKVVIETITEKGKSYNTFMLPIYKNSINTAVIEVVDLDGVNKLPNDETYAMNLVNYQKFDFESLTGEVAMIDLNYDRYEHSQIKIKENKIISWIAKGLSEELKKKYSNSKVIVPELSIYSQALRKRVPLDSNNDGNLSFSECYKGFNDAIDANGFSSWVCDIPIAGWLSCWGSVSTACVILSAIY